MSQKFPKTRNSAIVAMRSGDAVVRRRAWEAILRAYWKPVYAHLRLKWRRQPAEAEDLTQAFFAAAFEKHLLEAYDPSRTRFRTYLRSCLDYFVLDDQKASTRLKRGGAVTMVSLEFATAETDLADSAVLQDADAAFDVEWKRSLFAAALAAFRADCEVRGKIRHCRVFEAYYLAAGEPPSYAEIGRMLGIPVTDVTNSLHYARRQFRRFVLDTLRELCATDEELQLELDALSIPRGDLSRLG